MKTEIKQLRASLKAAQCENEKLRDALAPFACLARGELRQGDFNRARRALASLVVKTEKPAKTR
jgi:predicted ATPase